MNKAESFKLEEMNKVTFGMKMILKIWESI